ncbi:MAG: protein kinase [Candidatus Pacebacteria bacterium]|nr:protein kinase [Candidatus Paceibacterota bacterium]
MRREGESRAPKALQIQSKLYQLGDLYCECGKPMQDMGKRLCAGCMAKRRGTRIEGFLIKQTRSRSELAKFWIAVEHQDIYCYRDKSDKSYKCVHGLIGCIVKEEPAEKHGKETLYPFALHFANGKVKRYYAMSKDHLKKWLQSLKRNTNTAVISDYYDFKQELGKGRFGSVSLGIHKKTGKKVAIKCMNKGVMSAQELALVQAEVEVLRICQHPNIVRLYDTFESANHIYLVMELLEGGDMMDYLQKKEFKVPEARAAKIIHSLAAALYYLHSYGIVHRDLKPDNVLLESRREDSDVKLIDFGLSKIVGPTEQCTEGCGTLFYAAPEIVEKRPYDKSVDIWAVGVIAYLLLTGELPFNDLDDQKLIKYADFADVL